MAVERFRSTTPGMPHQALLRCIYDYADSGDATPESFVALYTMAVVTYGEIDPATFTSERDQAVPAHPLAVAAGDIWDALSDALEDRDPTFVRAVVQELAMSPFWQVRWASVGFLRSMLGRGYSELDQIFLSRLVNDPDRRVLIVCRELLSDSAPELYRTPEQAAEALWILASTDAFMHPAPSTEA